MSATSPYDADVDEMTMGALATLEQLRGRLIARGLTAAALVVDEYAAEIAADHEEEE